MKPLQLVTFALVTGMTIGGVAFAQGAGSAGNQAAPAAPSPATIEQGRKLFVSYGCYQCHGYEGQGSTATGPRLAPRPIPLANILRYVRQPTGEMPPFTAKVLSDADLTTMYAFLQSRPAPPAAANIPLLKQ